MNKIHVEELMENAEDWWETIDGYERQDIILREYMKTHKINDGDVAW